MIKKHQRSITLPAFTLVELMLVISIIGVLASMAIPYMSRVAQYRSVVFQSEEIRSQIYYARTYSINRNNKCFIDVLNDSDSLKFYYGTDASNRQPIPVANSTDPMAFDGFSASLDINPSASGTQTIEFSKHGKPAADYQIAFNDMLIKIDGRTGRVYVD